MAIPKRIFAASLFGATGLSSAYVRIRSMLRQEVRILTYHRVVDLDRAYDVENVSATPDAFGQQLKHYNRNYDVLRVADLCDIHGGSMRCPKRPLLITFDDGYTDNYEIAYPMLKENGLTAAFFVSTSHVGLKELFWFEELGFLIRYTEKSHISLPDGTELALSVGDRGELIKSLLWQFKQLPNEERLAAMNRLRDECDTYANATVDRVNLPMTWDQLTEMNNDGMEILSHSHTHPVLATLESVEQIDQELQVSKKLLEDRLGNNCRAIAYPDGQWHSYDERVLASAERAGYELAFNYVNGLNAVSAQGALRNSSHRCWAFRPDVRPGCDDRLAGFVRLRVV